MATMSTPLSLIGGSLLCHLSVIGTVLRRVESVRDDGLLLRPIAFQTGFPGRHPETLRGSSPATDPPDPPSATGAGGLWGALGPLILGGAKKCTFLAPCGAKSWGSGGAPPTNLILLRNQWSRALPVARRTAGAAGAPIRAVLGHPGAKNPKKFSFFLRKVVFVSGWTNGGVAIACGDVAVGGGRGRRLPHCLRSATLGVGPSRARFPVAGCL